MTLEAVVPAAPEQGVLAVAGDAGTPPTPRPHARQLERLAGGCLAAATLAALVGASLVDGGAPAVDRVGVSAVITCFAAAGVIATRARSTSRLGVPTLLLSLLAGTAVLTGAANDVHARGIAVASPMLTSARIAEAVAIGMIAAGLYHLALALGSSPDTPARRSSPSPPTSAQVSSGTARSAHDGLRAASAYAAGAAVGVAVWAAWGAELHTHLWPFALAAAAAVVAALVTTLRRYDLARSDELPYVIYEGPPVVKTASPAGRPD
jgi:hypothetical protein